MAMDKAIANEEAATEEAITIEAAAAILKTVTNGQQKQQHRKQ